MKKTIAFDVYGTLIDTKGTLSLLKGFVGSKALLFAETWRTKQLEYSFRRGLMKQYAHFSVCTRDALNFTCMALEVNLTDEQKKALLESYLYLPAFDDVETTLRQLSQHYQLVAFSNGEYDAVTSLLNHANISHYFSNVVTADGVETFKPNPEIYQYLLARAESTAENTWLISSNPFDVIGAKSFGLKAAWVKRSSAAVYDPWGIEPNITINNLESLFLQLSK